MKFIAVFLLAALSALAQTGVPLSAIRAEAPSERVLVYIPGIGILALQFDPAQIAIDRSTTPFTVRLAAQPPPPPPPTETRVNLKPGTGIILAEYTLPEAAKAGTIKFYRNGLLLTEGDDYTTTLNGSGVATLHFVPSQVIAGPQQDGQAGDTAIAFYTKQ